ncbi:MAG: heavy metal-associated domain-containing protein [candidate division KSB1 bacterium]|jgi:copper chaperone CopZ|nr:heavy metal-associated domain-containing protein [candidate division KSB1 bacterium]
MKIKTFFMLLLLSIFSVSSLFIASCTENTETENSSMPAIAEVTIPVQGMTCGSCEHHIETEVKRQEGVVEIKADHEQAVVFAKYDSTVMTLDDVVAAINQTGYKAVKP